MWRAYYVLVAGRRVFKGLWDRDPEGEIPRDWVRVDLQMRPQRNHVWNETTGVFEARRKPLLGDAISNLLSDPLLDALPPATKAVIQQILEVQLPVGSRRPLSPENYPER